MRRSKALRLAVLTAAAALLLGSTALAWSPEDTVGRPSMLLAGMSGLGSLSEESVLGDACADAVRAAAGSDLALVMGGEFTANLEPRSYRYDELCAVLREPEKPLAVARVSAAELKEILEAGFAAVTLGEDEAIDRAASASMGFPQISGLSVVYDTSARAGERVMRLVIGGEKVELTDEEKRYTLAATADVFAGAEGYPETECEALDCTLAQALADFVAAGTPDDYSGSGRIRAVGCTDDSIVRRFPVVFCVLAAIVIWLGSRLWKYKYAHRASR